MANILKVNEIQHTGGTTALTVDTNGRLLTPARPRFNVHLLSTSFTSVNYTSITDCPFDTIDFNIINRVVYTSTMLQLSHVAVTGHLPHSLYVGMLVVQRVLHVNSYLFVDNTANSTSTDLDYRHIEDPQGGTYNMDSHSNALMQLNANQTVNPKISINVDTSINVRRSCRFWGYLVG